MIIFGNRKGNPNAPRGPSGSPIASLPTGPNRSSKSGADTASCCARLPRVLDVPLVGVDFSPTQLAQARVYLDGLGGIDLVLGSGTDLPFVDGGFDLVVTSAVILHNPPAAAERIRCEVVRLGRRFTAHNEDTGTSYNRYGYDTVAWYRAAGIPLAESGPMPIEAAPEHSQFCVAMPWLR